MLLKNPSFVRSWRCFEVESLDMLVGRVEGVP